MDTTTMTESTSLDTLATAKDLQSAGFERKQAEALTEGLAQMATKGDIARLERAINERLEAALKAFGEVQQANYRTPGGKDRGEQDADSAHDAAASCGYAGCGHELGAESVLGVASALVARFAMPA